jgi:hypothetical protein
LDTLSSFFFLNCLHSSVRGASGTIQRVTGFGRLSFGSASFFLLRTVNFGPERKVWYCRPCILRKVRNRTIPSSTLHLCFHRSAILIYTYLFTIAGATWCRLILPAGRIGVYAEQRCSSARFRQSFSRGTRHWYGHLVHCGGKMAISNIDPYHSVPSSRHLRTSDISLRTWSISHSLSLLACVVDLRTMAPLPASGVVCSFEFAAVQSCRSQTNGRHPPRKR